MCSRHLEDGAGAAYADEPERHRYRIHLQADQWDSDSHRYYMDVYAISPDDATAQAHELNRHAGVRRVEFLR